MASVGSGRGRSTWPKATVTAASENKPSKRASLNILEDLRFSERSGIPYGARLGTLNLCKVRLTAGNARTNMRSRPPVIALSAKRSAFCLFRSKLRSTPRPLPPSGYEKARAADNTEDYGTGFRRKDAEKYSRVHRHVIESTAGAI